MAIEDDIRIRLETLTRIDVALSADRDICSLMARIIEAARQFTLAVGATFYRKSGDLLRSVSLSLNKAGGVPADLPAS